jgi:hypothetical protein
VGEFLFGRRCRVCGRRYRSSVPKLMDDELCGMCRAERLSKLLGPWLDPELLAPMSNLPKDAQ